MRTFKLIYIFIYFSLISCDIKSAESYAIEAERLADKGEFSESNKVLDKALKKDPFFVGAYINKGANYSQLGDFKNAIKSYNIALSIDSDNTMILYNIANNYKRIENYKEALKYYNKALKTKGGGEIYFDYNTENSFIDLGQNYDVSGKEIIYERAITYLELDSVKLSISDFKHCINRNHNISSSYYYLGVIYLNYGRDSLACINLRKSAYMGDKDAQELLNQYCK